ncbi:MAG: TolC family protein [Chlorobiota bacterium]|nr:MAG: TolC family protein [Chlorobiota bacterium]
MNKFLIIVTLLFTQNFVFAQVKSYTLKESIDLALSNNLSIKNAILGVETANKQIDFAYTSTLPKIDVNSKYIRNFQKQIIFFPNQQTGIATPIKIGSDNSLSSDVTISQIVFNSAAFKAPELAKEYAVLSQKQVLNEGTQTILNIKKSYLSAMFLREVLVVQKQSLNNLEESANISKLLFEKGLRPEIDAIRSRVQADNQLPLVTNATDNYKNALDGLKLIMGIPENEQIDVKDTIWQIPKNDESITGNNELVRKNLEIGNPQLQTLKIIQSLNEKFIDIKKSDYLPTVAAFGTYQLQTQFDGFSEFSLKPTSFVGLNATWNIFNGGRTNDTIEIQKIEIEKNKIQYNNALNSFSTQTKLALRRMESAKERVMASENTIMLAEKGYKIANASYKAGAATQLQVSDADLALSQSKLLRLNAIYDYNISLTEYESLFGFNIMYENNNLKVKN